MKRDTDKITLEDLLRLKRAERPPTEFWAKFDSEMRAKQLSAIVSRKPWWSGLSQTFSSVGRMQLPLGAAAALALTWMGFHYAGTRPVPVRQLQANAVQPHAAAVVVSSRAPEKALMPVRETVESMVADIAPPEKPMIAATTSHIVPAPVSAAVQPSLGSPFSEGIAVTLADYRNVSPELPRNSTFGTDRDFEAAVAPARQPVSEPLAQMDPAEERRARLLAPALSQGNRAFAADWMKQRASSNDRMYESMDDDHSSNERALVGFRF